ncbi:MAG: hypothetical protein KDE33_14220 [Bacteroidetes bacterium]|nr:hypothetical protein [Bacteroidota bacterium]
MTGRKNDSWSTYHRNRLLIFGLFVTGFGIFQFSTLLTFKSQLTDIKGLLSSAETYVTTVTERSRGSKSQKSELIFYISGRQQKFRLVENIGNDYHNEEFEKIKKDLKRADSITVWVKKTELDTYEPKIFQIDTDRKTILEFEKVRTKDSGLTLFFLFLGIGSLIFYFWTLYPEKFKKLLSDDF